MIDPLSLEPVIDIGEFEIFASGLDHPECVTRGRDTDMYAGGEAGQIYRIDGEGAWDEISNTGGFVLGLAADGEDNLFACDYKQKAVYRVDAKTHKSEVYSSGSETRPMVQPNYPVFDRHGNLYVSDSGTWEGNDGCLWLVRSGGETTLLSDSVSAFPNGLALDPERQFLYVVLSNLPGIIKLPVRDGVATGDPVLVAELPDTVPDGIAFDAAGTLYVSCFAPDAILRISPTGDVDTLAYDRRHSVLASPANIAFCGSDRSTLVVSNFGGWHLSRVAAPCSGAPLEYPVGVLARQHEGSER